MAQPNTATAKQWVPAERRFSSLSVKDLLDARNAYHVHLSHMRNVVATAIGRYRLRMSDLDYKRPANAKESRSKSADNTEPRRLDNTTVRPWSWPCVMVFVRQWFATREFRLSHDNYVPPFLHLPDGRVVPTCVVLVEEQETTETSAPDYVFPSTRMGGGFPVITETQQHERTGSLGCLVSDGDTVYALTNRHVAGKEGESVYSILRGERQKIGVASGKSIGKLPFEQVYPGWPGTHTFVNLDAGLIRVDDLRHWSTQVYGVGQIGEPVDLNTDTITLDLIGCPVTAFGCASGPLKGRIEGFFYRYKTMGGVDYTADILIGPRENASPLATRPGDSGTPWFVDPETDDDDDADDHARSNKPGARKLQPLAIQWGAHGLTIGSGKTNFPLALATCLSTICRELDVDIVRDWNQTNREYWGKIGHYKSAAVACDLVSDPKLTALMRNNRKQIAFDDAAISLGRDFTIDRTGFVPLADVPDYVWRMARGRGVQSPPGSDRKKRFPDHHADMDALGGGPYKRQTLLTLCEDRANVDVRVWNRFYESLDVPNSERGMLPFRVWQMYDAMVEYLRDKDLERFVCTAGIMAHFVADACQPLHISRLHHGENESEKNVHAVYEETMLEPNVRDMLDRLNDATAGKSAKARVRGGYAAAVATVELMEGTFQTLPPARILDVYREVRGRGQSSALWESLRDETIEVLADGCTCLADLWESAWKEAGVAARLDRNDLKAVDRDVLRGIYLDPEFLPDHGLQEWESRGMGFAPNHGGRRRTTRPKPSSARRRR